MTNGALRATANSSSVFCLPPKTPQPASSSAGTRARKALRMFVRSFRRPFAVEKGAEQQDDDTDANRGVADIKDIKGPERAKMQVEKVEDVTKLHPIDDIAKSAAQYHRQRQLVAALLF